MRTLTSAILTTLFFGFVMAGDTSRPVTYVAGNVTGLSPTAGATLLVEAKALSLRANGNAVEIPYAAISKAELNGSPTKAASDPFYKVWTLPKRLSGINEMQQVLLDYKESNGEARSLTLEMQRATATDVIGAIEEAQAEAKAEEKAARLGWWGNKYWKTSQNPALKK